MADQLVANKQVVRDFYDLAFNQHKPADAAARFIGNTYRQHNPGAADGVPPFVAFVAGVVAAFPALKVTFKRVVAEGDLVVLHSHFVRYPDDRGMAAMDIFRLENSKIVEHWDVVQDVPEMASNSNSMF